MNPLTARSVTSGRGQKVWSGLRRFFPRGGYLAGAAWDDRHRMTLRVLWLHVFVVPVFGIIRGVPGAHVLLEASALFALALAASRSGWNRRGRAVAAVLGLLTASAILVHFADGRIEMHFHFFVMIGVIALYQDWLTFLTAIAFVGLHHGVAGTLAPASVFDHPSALLGAWKWAAIHTFFILAASAAQITGWRLAEEQHDRADEDLRASERRFRALIEYASDAVVILDATGRIDYVSPSAQAMTGWPTDRLAGRRALEFVHPDDLTTAEALLGGASPGGPVLSAEFRTLRPDGSWQRVEVHARNLLHRPEVAGIVANVRDVTVRRELETRLEYQAFHDALTGLANRRLFLDRLEEALAVPPPSGGSLAVLLLDLDDFKSINDGLGHAAGDAVLVETGDRIRRCLRGVDLCARLGGDEFAILVEQVSGEATQEVAARILAAVAEPLIVDETLVEVSASLGIAYGGDDAEALIRHADLAMYRAKEAGKSCTAVFGAGMDEAARRRLALKADLRRAVEAKEFVPHYQPIVDLLTGAVVGAEALVRWQHPDGELLAPGSFIGLAEEIGVITTIGRSVLDEACREAASWPAGSDGRELMVGVNLSARQLQDPGLTHDVAAALACSGLPAPRLTLEITESVLIDDPGAAAATLAELKGLGVMLALDDFGTGYSSLLHLARFPVDVVKIDKSFVDGLDPSAPESDPRLVEAITVLARSLGLGIVAEGIEQAAVVESLARLGCTTGQGYLFARPMPGGAFRLYLQGSRTTGAVAT